MDYGKLVVRWSDGAVEEHPVVKATTSIGRAPGNDIVLPTSAVSRYHAHIKVEGKRVILADLGTVNGTFVNNELMPPNSELQLVGGEEILLGDAMLVYHPPVGERKTTVVAPLEPGVEVVEEPSGFRVALDEPRQSVAPGARLQLSLVIENQTGKAELYTVELIGMQPEWAKVNRHEIHLEPREQTEVTITVRPPRSSDTVPNQYPLTVRVASKDDSRRALELTRQISVVGYGGLGVVVRPGRSPGTYQLAVQNQGNVSLEVQLGGWHPRRALRYQFEPGRLNLGAGETQQVSLTVRPARPKLVGAPEEISFAVVARSLDAAGYQAPVPATYTSAPTLPGWVIWAAIPAALTVFAVVGLLVLRLVAGRGGGPLAGRPTETATLLPSGPAPATAATTAPEEVLGPPEITTLEFRASDDTPLTQIEGVVPVAWANQDGVGLAWGVENANTMNWSDDCGLIAQQPVESPYLLDLRDAEPGTCTFTLSASNEAGEAVPRSESLEIRTPVCTIERLGGVTPYSTPDEGAERTSRLAPRTEVQPYRQHGDWLLIRDQSGSRLGWVGEDDLDCQDFDLETVQFAQDAEPIVVPSVAEPTVEPAATAEPGLFGG